jgi:hypothetical protein
LSLSSVDPVPFQHRLDRPFPQSKNLPAAFRQQLLGIKRKPHRLRVLRNASAPEAPEVSTIPMPSSLTFADLIEDEPQGVDWHMAAETRRLLDMMSPVNRKKAIFRTVSHRRCRERMNIAALTSKRTYISLSAIITRRSRTPASGGLQTGS